MVKLRPEEKHFHPRVEPSVKERQRLPVVKIRYVRMPDAKSRLSRAIDILLGSAARELERSVNAEKEEEPPQEAGLKEVTDQTDEGKI